jgi:hypothetical protein
MRNKRIRKFTPPSQVVKKELTRLEKEAVENVAKKQGISLKEAKSILTSDEKFMEIMSVKDKEIRMDMIGRVLPKILEAAELKTERGSMEQAQKAITAWGIGKDKAMGADKYSGTAMNIGGKNVQINMGWKFKPYKSK